MSANYFQSHIDYFWCWEDGDQVIAIQEGNTIIYREPFHAMLQQLADEGLPPLGTLLLSLVALNTQGSSDLQFIENKLRPTIDCSADAFLFLSNLSDVPQKYKEGKWKINLLKSLFKDCHEIKGQKQSRALVTYYKHKTHEQLGEQIQKFEGLFRKDLRPLALLHRAMPSTADIMARLKNVPTLKEELLLEQEGQSALEPANFIDELIDDYKTNKVGSLVKMIWSGLNLPVHHSSPSQQPMGGVSDLTNKGNYDQLLISEYANDDIIFLSRLANNEALFLSRESPPVHNEMKRVILIDSTIKSWGTPKILAFSTMLAICKHPKTDIDCDVYVVGASYKAIGHNYVDEIIEGIQFADASIDCAKGIAAFLAEQPFNSKDELFIITEKSTLAQDGMRFVMNEYHDNINYWIYTDKDGCIDVYKNRKNGNKHIQHLEIPLQRLWQKNQPKVETIPREQVDYYPILVRMSQSMIGIACTENGEIYQVNKERTLLRFHRFSDKPQKSGWEILSENIRVTNKDFEVGTLNNGDVVILLFSRQHKEITLINLRDNEEVKTYFAPWKSRYEKSFVFKDEHFFFGNNHETWRIDMQGQVTKEVNIANELYKTQQARIQQARSTYRNFLGNFKNVKRVGITDMGHLLLNVHKLELNHRKQIHLISHHNVKVNVSASAERSNHFAFDDGSVVKVNRSGFVSLRSSDESIPTIYIPLVLNHSLGCATTTEFAGNQYYFNQPMHEVVLKDAGPSKLKVVKEIKLLTGHGLRLSKEIVDDCPRSLLRRFTFEEANKVKTTLTDLSCIVEIIPENPSMQSITEISAPDFYENYIRRFIKTIEKHHFGTKIKN